MVFLQNSHKKQNWSRVHQDILSRWCPWIEHGFHCHHCPLRNYALLTPGALVYEHPKMNVPASTSVTVTVKEPHKPSQDGRTRTGTRLYAAYSQSDIVTFAAFIALRCARFVLHMGALFSHINHTDKLYSVVRQWAPPMIVYSCILLSKWCAMGTLTNSLLHRTEALGWWLLPVSWLECKYLWKLESKCIYLYVNKYQMCTRPVSSQIH